MRYKYAKSCFGAYKCTSEGGLVMKSANHIQQSNVQSFLEKMPTIFKWLSFFSVLLLPVIALAAGAETKAMSVEYRDVPGIGSRNLVWIVAQQHLLLAGFVLGVPIFAWVCEIVGWKTKEARYDKLAKEFTKLLTSADAMAAMGRGELAYAEPDVAAASRALFLAGSRTAKGAAVLDAVTSLHRTFPDLPLIGGNVATAEGCEALI